MSAINQNIINPKPCNYGCNTQIYWNTSTNEYLEIFTKNHICPSLASYYNKKSFV
jgi:hypothetical protein